MNCMNCGAPVRKGRLCPQCGCDLSVQRKALQLSVHYYNQGLDKAQIRDLSGAIDLLRRSLKYDKRNLSARNLLGLVYFETGETVSALSEWIISKNIKPGHNIASEYIRKLQSEPAKLDILNQTIKNYNIALKCCRDGNEDVAVIQLKKILNQNPKLIKAYHLLALIYIKREEYEKGRRILKKAARIDKTNSTTLRFLKEIDQQTGTVTTLEGRRGGLWSKRGEGEKEEKERNNSQTYISDGEVIIQPTSFRETSAFSNIMNIIMGILVGGLVVWFLVVPSVKQTVNRTADEKIVEYSNTMASQTAQLEELQKQIEESNATVESAQTQIQDAQKKSDAYEALFQAYNAYQSQNYEQASKALEGMDVTLLSVDAKAVYDSIYGDIQDQMFTKYSQAGVTAFEKGDYTTAIDNLAKAKAIKSDDYTVLTYLAHSYRLSRDIQNALTAFQDIVTQFPDTRRATTAQHYINLLKQGEIGDTPSDLSEASDTGTGGETDTGTGTGSESDTGTGTRTGTGTGSGDEADTGEGTAAGEGGNASEAGDGTSQEGDPYAAAEE